MAKIKARVCVKVAIIVEYEESDKNFMSEFQDGSLRITNQQGCYSGAFSSDFSRKLMTGDFHDWVVEGESAKFIE